eukprot:6888099-Alexandrium_andersonii.AAC.1
MSLVNVAGGSIGDRPQGGAKASLEKQPASCIAVAACAREWACLWVPFVDAPFAILISLVNSAKLRHSCLRVLGLRNASRKPTRGCTEPENWTCCLLYTSPSPRD